MRFRVCRGEGGDQRSIVGLIDVLSYRDASIDVSLVGSCNSDGIRRSLYLFGACVGRGRSIRRKYLRTECGDAGLNHPRFYFPAAYPNTCPRITLPISYFLT